MAKTDWNLSKTVYPEDMNQIGSEINQLRSDVDNIEIPPASLTVPGIVQLSNKTDGTSELVATTEKAVNDARQAAIVSAQGYVTSLGWQKHQLTQSTGLSINVSNGNANNLIKNGDYVGENIANAPTSSSGAWWYIRVSAMASDYVKQEAMNLFNNTYQTRTGNSSSGSIVWGVWSPDLFQSGVDAKNGIVGAINAMGGSASTSDTWATLAAKISTIDTGLKFATGSVTSTPNATVKTFEYLAGGSFSNRSYITIPVSSIGFRPKAIMVRLAADPTYAQYTNHYTVRTRNAAPAATAGNNYNAYIQNEVNSMLVTQWRVYEMTGSNVSAGAYINDNEVILPSIVANTLHTWEAYSG